MLGTSYVLAFSQQSSFLRVTSQNRSEFDLLLLNHARSCGVKVFEGTKVTSIGFDPTSRNATPDGTIDIGRPINVSWTSSTAGQTTYTHLVDASGRAGLISTSHLKNRRFNESLKNIAVWGLAPSI